ncbi:TetR/AcrR family transcriptional regulator [Acinetobacter sp. AOR15_HL]|uniref:TetR/AcrR family transcriptional regulator n=1 Tax=unclassified Acinetobacter TaxID=196816 RepID=UPI0022EA8956|nr:MULTISPECIES: TetR/AcrR family transcriptional regulator [unclassified Acinetobacter]MDA3559311.1 TetR/AcrR family transcriptional regulator [Acinetobacter sp. AOR15_HL]MDA3573648.1 TetR/AcrR family transcriptional regulator [Acinetobacter sp. AOR14_HL]
MNYSNLPKRPRGRPTKHGINYADTKDVLIRRGIELLTERGMNAMSLDDLMKPIQIPKGSFYHYFENKEAFILEVLDAYETYFVKRLNKFLSQPDLTPLEKLQNFVKDAGEKLQKYDFKRGCILGNLGQEVSYLAPEIIARIESIFQVWQTIVSDCLREFYFQYSLVDCNEVAYQFWIGWEGAVLRARLTKSTSPLEAFFRLFSLAVEQLNYVKN